VEYVLHPSADTLGRDDNLFVLPSMQFSSLNLLSSLRLFSLPERTCRIVTSCRVPKSIGGSSTDKFTEKSAWKTVWSGSRILVAEVKMRENF
jgi:hypothetical protein